MQIKLLGNISIDINETDQLLIKYSVFVAYWRRKWEYNVLFIGFTKSFESVKREGIVE
jgi:hypothetical protein